MQARNEKGLPAKVHGDKLCGDQNFIDLLGVMNIGWTPDLVGTAGEKCVKIIVSAMWYIDPCRKQFVERGIHLPSVLDQFQGYNDWKTKKSLSSLLTRLICTWIT